MFWMFLVGNAFYYIAGLSHECGSQQRIPQTKKRDRVHSLLRMHKSLPYESTALEMIDSLIR